MKRYARIAGIVVLGSVIWGILWNLAGFASVALWPEHLDDVVRIDHVGILVGYLLVSIVLSLGVGALAARLGGADARRAVLSLALVQLAIGLAVQMGYWNLMPLWYHLCFLVAIVPATLAGGWIVLRGAQEET